MSDVTPNFKERIACPCGCGLEGRPLTPFSDGVRHVAGCINTGCRRCRGRNSKRKGGVAQRRAQKLLAVPKSSSLSTGHEEFAGGLVRFEIKSGAQVRPLRTAFGKAEAQSEAARALGDNRPFVMGSLAEANGKEMIVAFRVRNEDDMRATVAALAMQLGLIEP